MKKPEHVNCSLMNCFSLCSVFIALIIALYCPVLDLNNNQSRNDLQPATGEPLTAKAADSTRITVQKVTNAQANAPRSPIRITSDCEFKSQFPAQGTADDPCVVAGYSITPAAGYSHLIEMILDLPT